MLHYIIQVVVFQALFLGLYDLFFKRETFFNHNRAYLILTPILSLILPFIKLNIVNTDVVKDYVVRLPEVIIGKSVSTSSPIGVVRDVGTATISSEVSIWQIIFIVGASLASVYFIYKLIKLHIIKFKNPKRWTGDVLIINILNSDSAFSFFNNIFIGELVTKKEHSIILEHELIHVKEKHSIDLLIFEVLRILMWFNPMIYLYQRRVKMLHEYIADAKTIRHSGEKQYYKTLLNQVFKTDSISFINTFFTKSLIKKRIDMLQKPKSKQSKLLKYTLLIPVVFGMLFYVSCDKESNATREESNDLERLTYTVKIDEEASEDIKKMRTAYDGFLRSNPGYVSWATIDYDNDIITYSIHSVKEEIPEGYSEANVEFADGTSYQSFYNYREGYFFAYEYNFDGEPIAQKEEYLIEKLEDLTSQDGEQDIVEVVEEEKPNGDRYTDNVPYAHVDKVPTFESCLNNNDTQKAIRRCTTTAIAKHVNKNFDLNLSKALGLKGKQRISVLFNIDTQGVMQDLKVEAPHPDLKAEVVRVMGLLPKFTPGEHKGKLVNVSYVLPIVFKVNE